MSLRRRIRFWVREGIRERLHYHWVRKNPWLRAKQLDRERRYWKAQATGRDYP